MFHIKNDRRSVNSAETLVTALLDLLNDHEFENINITKLVNKARVGRSTFYRNFDQLIDVLHWKCTQQFNEVVDSFDVAFDKYNIGLIDHLINYWVNNCEIIEILLRLHRTDVIYTSYLTSCKEINEEVLVYIPEYAEYINSMRLGLFVAAMQTWILNGKKETAEQLSDKVKYFFEFLKENDSIL